MITLLSRQLWRRALEALRGKALLGFLVLPLTAGPSWTEVQYSSIAKNQVSFSDDTLRIRVRKSASPLVYKFETAKKIKSITLHGRVLGEQTLRFPANITQGQDGFDDYVFRLGLVLKGKKRLNWLQRQVSPPWVRTLFSLAPKGVGVSGLYFLGVGSQQKVIGAKRTHPKSKLLQEEVVSLVQKDGQFTLSKTFSTPQDTLALWLSADGDDLGASFDIEISKVAITTAP